LAVADLSFGSRLDDYPAEWERFETHIAELAKLPARIQGTADFLGNNPGIVAAHPALRYTPRPMIESINAQTERLAEANAAFFRSERAPEHVLFEVAWYPMPPFDRFPAINDGPSWFELLSRYDLSHNGQELLVFSKRSIPRPLQQLPLTVQKARWNQEITLPRQSNSLLWAQVRFGDTAIGRFVEAIYKRPCVFITVQTSIGREFRHSLVPRMAAAGFLLSPLVAETEDMASVATALAQNEGLDELEQVDSIRISVEGDRRGYYQDEFTLTLKQVPLENSYPAHADPKLVRIKSTSTEPSAR
jgi:hypothetical protein